MDWFRVMVADSGEQRYKVIGTKTATKQGLSMAQAQLRSCGFAVTVNKA